jgi:hypothetical protein
MVVVAFSILGRNQNMPDIRYSYKDVPTIQRLADDDTFIRAITGPYGSGKSTGAGVIEAVNRMMRQAPGPDGVRRSRGAVVRNTYPQLLDTTIKTFMEWLPHTYYGDYRENPRPDYLVNKLTAPDGSPIECEVIFRALDKPEHVKNLLSLELTWCWFNEIREIAKPIFNHMRGRVNRYPSMKDGGPTWSGIFGDTNPCDTDHWFYEFFELEKPQKCSTCKTANGGMILYPSRDPLDNIIPLEQRFCPKCGADHTHSVPLTSIYHQPSARGPKAENLSNLPPDYYPLLMMGQTQDFIRVYVDGEYGYVGEGKPVYLNWSTQIHAVQGEIKVIKSIPLIVGLDFGLNPAAIICQSTADRRFNVIDELTGKDIVFREFITRVLKPYLQSKYLGMDIVITGDPSGVKRQETDGNTCFKELKNQKLPAIPAPSNTLPARLAAVNSLLTRPLVKISDTGDMQSPFQVSATKCLTLVKGFQGGYHRKRVAVIGKEMYRDEPEKTFESHIHDALQYAALLVETGTINVSRSMSSLHGQGQKFVAPPTGAFT